MRIIRGNEIPFIPASHEDQDRPGVLKRVVKYCDGWLPIGFLIMPSPVMSSFVVSESCHPRFGPWRRVEHT